jgi:Flp pilus assembly pilin Flp
MTRCLGKFFTDETGAVTVDFVVLTALVVTVAMLIAPMIIPKVQDTASGIGDTVLKYEDFLK